MKRNDPDVERQKAEALLAHADALDMETHLLEKAGYFDANGNPRRDAEGQRIWNEVQKQISNRLR